MKRLSLIDACFLRMESIETPMHVGALMTFRRPPQAGPEFLSDFVQRLRGYPVSRPPFNRRLARGPLSGLLPAWETAPRVDLDYHLRHSALPHPGGERELGGLISRLHSHPLDLSRPPWECHVIEGLADDRFAIYLKGHHAAIDGAGGLRLIKDWLTQDPEAVNRPPPWAMPLPTPLRTPGSGPVGALLRHADRARDQLLAIPELYRSLRHAARHYPNGSLAALIKAPRTTLNGEVSRQRRFAAQSLRLSRLKLLAEHSGATVNDVLLAICGGALRRYLLELDALPATSLVSLVPIALRPRRGQIGGNSLSGLLADLETQIADPVERLKAISASTRAGKRHVEQLSAAARSQYSLMLFVPLTFGRMIGLDEILPPLFNVLISNVPAARHTLYYEGAELDGLFPLSVLFRGQALNITALGYADTFTLSFTACRKSVPSVQRLAVYTGEALDELEQALGIADNGNGRVVSIQRAHRLRERLAAQADRG